MTPTALRAKGTHNEQCATIRACRSSLPFPCGDRLRAIGAGYDADADHTDTAASRTDPAASYTDTAASYTDTAAPLHSDASALQSHAEPNVRHTGLGLLVQRPHAISDPIPLERRDRQI